MIILFVRHTESIDDLTNQFGGWLDLPLTPNGKHQVIRTADKISELNLQFHQIYHSPLVRAKETANILSSNLRLPVAELLYFKEKNGYGLLTGLTKEEAAENYPELIKELDVGYIYGSEPEEQFIERVKIGYQMLVQTNQNVIVVTHGGVLKRLLECILGYDYIKAHDGGFVLWDTATKSIKQSYNFDYKEKL